MRNSVYMNVGHLIFIIGLNTLFFQIPNSKISDKCLPVLVLKTLIQWYWQSKRHHSTQQCYIVFHFNICSRKGLLITTSCQNCCSEYTMLKMNGVKQNIQVSLIGSIFVEVVGMFVYGMYMILTVLKTGIMEHKVIP